MTKGTKMNWKNWLRGLQGVALLVASGEWLVVRGQSFTQTLQWSYPLSNVNFRVWGALGTTQFSQLALVTNVNTTLVFNLPAGVDNRFYVTAIDPKQVFPGTTNLLESGPGKVVTNRIVLPNPLPLVTNISLTNLVLQP